MATEHAGRALLVPESVRGHRVGWFPDHGMAFAEGRLGEGELCPVADIASRAKLLVEELRNMGIPVEGLADSSVRRLDVAVDLWMDSSVEGLALLECVGSASPNARKVVTYRMGRAVQSVTIQSKAGRSQARLYDKGCESDGAERGRWIRFEAQWRFGRGHRLAPENLAASVLRERFQKRFKGLCDAAEGFEVGGVGAIADRLRKAVEAGRLPPSRARSIAGYLLLDAVGVSQGAPRTTYELERECRELGLSLSLLDQIATKRVDVASVLEECMAPEVWR